MNNKLSITFYKYFDFKDPEAERDSYRELMLKHDIKGKIILSNEGINGAIAGPEDRCLSFLNELKEKPELNDMTWRTTISDHDECFKRTLVKIRPEIVPLGVPGITPSTAGGGHPLKASELMRWYDEGEDFVILDTRNLYEAEAGRFKNALIPDIEKFRDFSSYLERISHLKNKKIVTYCTGGVRCEKASAFMRSKGFNNTYKLEGGIIEFLKIAGDKNIFEGELFVFDNRRTIKPKFCEL